MSQSPPSSGHLSPAAAAFAEYLAQIESGEDIEFADFCAERPKLRTALLKIQAKWQTMSNAFAEYADSGPEEPDAASLRRLDELGESTPPVGRYVEHGEIARGGMGSIVEVWDRDLRRTIAMKTLLGDAKQPRLLARFLDEAQVTGQLDHPGIVPVYELGMDATGRIYFTMPLIRGQDLDRVIEILHDGDEDPDSDWSVPRALGVLVRVCEAMAYAHSKGVVHRDLKPANVMIGRFGEIHVMDWGLARVMDEDSPVRSHRLDAVQDNEVSALLTLAGDIVGTPVYMAPEQARGEIDSIGPRTDIYAAGTMLYQLLSGHAPYIVPGSKDSSHEILTRVRQGPPVALDQLCPNIAPELLAVCEQAMARDPEQRYGDMLELAEDLRSFLEGRVVRAHETGAVARSRKWMQRNSWLAATAALALLSLVAGLLVSLSYGRRAHNSADDLAAQLTSSNIERGRLFAATGNLAQAENLIWTEHLAGSARSRTGWALRDIYSHQPCLATIRAHEADVRAVFSAPDGSFVVSACGADGRMEVWNPTSLQHVATVGDHGSPIVALAMTGDGTQLAAAGSDGKISIWDLPNRHLVRKLSLPKESLSTTLQFSPDGTVLVTGCKDHKIRIWHLASGNPRTIGSHAGRVHGIAFHPAGDILASTSSDQTVKLWAMNPSREHLLGTMVGHREGTNRIVFSADGQYLFTDSPDRTIRIWDTKTQASLGLLRADVGPMVLSPDGDTLYVAGYWRIDCWDLRTRKIKKSFALTDIPRSLHLDTSRHVLISGHNDGTIRFWDLGADRSVRRLAEHEGRVAAICNREGLLVATGDSSGALRLWEPRSGSVRRLASSEARIKSMCFSPDGELLAVGDLSGHLRVLRCADGALLHSITDHDATSLESAVFSPDGNTLAMTATEGRIQLLDPLSGRVTTEWQVDTRQVINLAFHPKGQILASTDRASYVRFWSLTGTLLHEHRMPKSPWSLAFSPDGRKLACGAWSMTIYVLDAASGRIEKRLSGHSGAVWGVAFDPTNANLLASISADQTARLWDVRSGQNTATLRGGDLAVSFSADGRKLTTGGFDHQVSVWDLDYFQRHVAGNLEYQLSRFDGQAIDVEALKREQGRILEQAWPR